VPGEITEFLMVRRKLDGVNSLEAVMRMVRPD